MVSTDDAVKIALMLVFFAPFYFVIKQLYASYEDYDEVVQKREAKKAVKKQE